ENYLSPTFINDSTSNTGGIPNSGDPKFEIGDKVLFDANNLVGSEISLAGDIITLRLGYFTSVIDSTVFSISKAKTEISSVGMIVNWNSLVIYSEYIDRHSDSEGNILFADQVASYITVGYRLSNYLPYITYAKLDKGTDDNPHSLIQNSITAGVRYELNETTDLKFELTQVDPNRQTGDIGRFGLLDKEVVAGEKPTIFAMSLDILF
ncbi:MAG: hypothetical protein ACC656_14710, partial [Candidatus Heimdallarchaeota archaeon]